MPPRARRRTAYVESLLREVRNDIGLSPATNAAGLAGGLPSPTTPGFFTTPGGSRKPRQIFLSPFSAPTRRQTGTRSSIEGGSSSPTDAISAFGVGAAWSACNEEAPAGNKSSNAVVTCPRTGLSGTFERPRLGCPYSKEVAVATTEPAARSDGRRVSIALWTISVLLALFFVAMGLPKVLGLGGWAGRFAAWGYPRWFVVLVGVGEIGGAVMLLVPRLARPGAAGLSGIMLGAVATHLRYGESARVIVSLILLTLLIVVAWRSRPKSTAAR